MILKLLLWLIPIELNVYLDSNGRKPDYRIMFIVRGIAALIHAVIVLPHPFGPHPDWMALGYFKPLVPYLPVFLFQVTSFWLIFELHLNIVRGNHPLYYDHKENDSGWIDGFFARVYRKTGHHHWHTIAKVIAFGLLILSTYLIYQQ